MKELERIILLAIFALAFAGCVGTQYVERKDYKDLTVLQGGRTGVFGTDNSWMYVQEKQEPQPDLYRLQESYSRQATIQTYNQKCPDPKQLKNIQTRTENVIENRFRDVPNPNKRPPVHYGAFGSSYSTGNLAVPAAFLAVGGATSGAFAPETKIITTTNTAVKSVGKGGTGGTGGPASSSSSSSSAASAAAAAAAAAGK